MGQGKLKRLDSKTIPVDLSEVRLFACVRDEVLRLPYFLKYYQERGIARFFIADNGSTDGTVELLLKHPLVHVFETKYSYAESGLGTGWQIDLLGAYGLGQWCLVADADEILVYPGWEQLSIPEFCVYLDWEQATAFRSVMLDMYSDKPFGQTEYRPGTDPLTVCPYFETDSIICPGSLPHDLAGSRLHHGGMRRRLFGHTAQLDKFCLLKYSSEMELSLGLHTVKGIMTVKARGALLHFKFFSDFPKRSAVEAGREEHWSKAKAYKAYQRVFLSNPDLTAFGPLSKRFSTSSDLLDCGIMRSTEALDALLKNLAKSWV